MPRFSLPKIPRFFLLFFILCVLSLSYLVVLGNNKPVLAGYCPDGTCDPDEDCLSCPEDCGVCPPGGACPDGKCIFPEDENTCPEDCGAPAPPGTEKCSQGTCPDGDPYWTYCSPDCTTIPRTCWDDPACEDDPPNCAEGGCPPGDCPTTVHCGPDAPPDCGVVVCNCAGGNCYSDCSDCPGASPSPGAPSPSPPVSSSPPPP